jgi:hypothetical protein
MLRRVRNIWALTNTGLDTEQARESSRSLHDWLELRMLKKAAETLFEAKNTGDNGLVAMAGCAYRIRSASS